MREDPRGGVVERYFFLIAGHFFGAEFCVKTSVSGKYRAAEELCLNLDEFSHF